MPFVAPKGASSAATSNSGPGGGGRTTFRPPWVKEDGTASTVKSTVKTSVPWAKKTAAEKENGEKPATTAPSALKKPTAAEPEAAAKKLTETKKGAEPTKKVVEPPKKVVEPAKKVVEPVKKIVAPVKKAPPEPIKKVVAAPAPATKTTTNASAKFAAVKKKEPSPSSSEEEEEESDEDESEEETEEETEEESEEEETDDEDEQPIVVKQPLRKPQQPQPKKEEEESELKRRFSIEKPKLRPVVVKRDKSMKKIEDDDEVVEGETEEERERRLRFKLEKPKLRHVKREEKPLPAKSTDNVLKIRPALKKVPKVDELIKEPKEEPKPEFKTKTLRKTPSISKSNVPAPPPLPSLVPKAPPPPPPPLGASGDKRELSSTKKAVIEKLKTRPRRRPDWSEMMKEVESGRKLRHVKCNDRSQPILTCKSMTKVDDKFIYETEKDNSHNILLKQIQGGIRLKPTRTNDRSKPVLDGLRKFRRQMTIEEQLQKSQSKVNMLGEAPGGAKRGLGEDVTDRSRTGSIVAALSIDDTSGDELDDIDKIRDDLQSTKQMLALELRNREAQERENKKLLTKIATLEAELAREKSREKNLEYGSNVIVATMDATPFSEEAYINSLKQEADDARKTSKELEKKYHVTGEILDEAKSEIEEQRRQIQMLERKLAQALQGDMTSKVKRPQFSFCYSYEDPNDLDTYYPMDSENETPHCNKTNKGGGSLNDSRRPSDAHTGRDSSPDFDLPLSESDPDEPEEKKNERRERRLIKEVKALKSKLAKLKIKQEASKKEKDAFKQAMKKNHVILKAENKKFKKLEKEVHKMAASMKEEEENEEADEEKEIENENEEAEEEEESEEESEESESEESEPDTESESEAEDATNADKKNNLEPRVKKHESRFSAMKKCNVLLQANVDNLQDEITQVRAKAASLQSELDAVLQDLGF